MQLSRARLVALTATVLVHLGVIAGLVSLSARVRTGELPVAPALAAFFIEQVTESVQSLEDRESVATRPESLQLSTAPMIAPLMPVENNAPQGIPLIDWDAEGKRVVEEFAGRLAAPTRNGFSTSPQSIDLPPTGSGVPVFAEDEQLEGGEKRFWVNDRCYYSEGPPAGPPSDVLATLSVRCKIGKNRDELAIRN